MGGYASIALSKLLNFDIVVAISPQHSIDEEFDSRWRNYADRINFKYRISRDSVKQNCNFFIIYDDKDLDELHVRRLLDVLPISYTQLIKLPFTGHPSSHYLSEVGLIKNLVIQIANKGSLDDFNFFANKKLSKTYLYNFSQNLFKRSRLSWALSTINSSILIDGEVAVFHAHKSRVLEKMGSINEAIIFIKNAIMLDPDNPHNCHHLNFLMSKGD